MDKQRELTVDERYNLLHQQVNAVGKEIETVSSTLDGAKTQIRVVVSDLNNVVNGYEEIIKKIKDDTENEIKAIRAELEAFKNQASEKKKSTSSTTNKK